MTALVSFGLRLAAVVHSQNPGAAEVAFTRTTRALMDEKRAPQSYTVGRLYRRPDMDEVTRTGSGSRNTVCIDIISIAHCLPALLTVRTVPDNGCKRRISPPNACILRC